MGAFFRRWRRRIGVTTMLIALAFMGAWVRSLHMVDGFGFHPTEGKVVAILSIHGRAIGIVIHGLNGFVPSARDFSVSRKLDDIDQSWLISDSDTT